MALTGLSAAENALGWDFGRDGAEMEIISTDPAQIMSDIPQYATLARFVRLL